MEKILYYEYDAKSRFLYNKLLKDETLAVIIKYLYENPDWHTLDEISNALSINPKIVNKIIVYNAKLFTISSAICKYDIILYKRITNNTLGNFIVKYNKSKYNYIIRAIVNRLNSKNNNEKNITDFNYWNW